MYGGATYKSWLGCRSVDEFSEAITFGLHCVGRSSITLKSQHFVGGLAAAMVGDTPSRLVVCLEHFLLAFSLLEKRL